MNIFATAEDPRVCAQNLDDKRVVKMVLETAQILSTAVWLHRQEKVAYRPTHQHHPCVRWAAASRENYRWTFKLFRCLAAEYTYRFGKTHKSWSEHHMTLLMCVNDIPEGEQTPFERCGPDAEADNTCMAYRDYLVDKWAADKRAPRWTRRGAPHWRYDRAFHREAA